jgi:threonine dehydrogenase-like Zn-dependent dehydrogenase
MEPTTVVAKAWEQILIIGQRSFWQPDCVLVVGTGPIGLLAAFIGVQRGREVHVLDRVTTGPKPKLVEELGAIYHSGTVAGTGLQPDIGVECTGVASLVQDAMKALSPGGILCLTGVGAPSAPTDSEPSTLATDAVLGTLWPLAPSTPIGATISGRRRYSPEPTGLGSSNW